MHLNRGRIWLGGLAGGVVWTIWSFWSATSSSPMRATWRHRMPGSF